MNNQTSELIRALRLLLIMGLVLVHFGGFPDSSLDPFQGVVNPEHFVPASINSFFLYFFLSAVPVLSIISGYLYSHRGKPNYVQALKKRFLTIVLPSITWTSIWLAFAFILYSIGKSSNQFTYYDASFSDFSLLHLVNGIIGITESPFALQFWFIHDLVLSLLLTPILYPLIKRAPFLLIGFFILWAIEWQAPVFFNLKVLTFFSVGLYLGQRNWQPSELNFLNNISIVAFIALILGRIYTPYYNNGDMPFETVYELILRSVGTFAVFSLALQLRKHASGIFNWLSNNSGYAFFIFAAHFPLIILFKQVLSMTHMFNGAVGQVALWVLAPVITIGFIIIAAKILNKILPSLYKFLNGQRSI
ncbi:MAG: acyltransferase [Oleispira sp.]|nr:acyltransferase [Oleispira sp.]MBL4880088.1 acyltransferase [Oleispira sp.]